MLAVALVAGCGSSGTTTVIEKQAAAPPTKTVTVQAASQPSATVTTQHTSSGASGSATGGHAVPKLAGERLDVAEDKLTSEGLRYKEIGGGTFGIIVKSNWTVCQTEPAAGEHTSGRVRLIVDRDC